MTAALSSVSFRVLTQTTNGFPPMDTTPPYFSRRPSAAADRTNQAGQAAQVDLIQAAHGLAEPRLGPPGRIRIACSRSPRGPGPQHWGIPQGLDAGLPDQRRGPTPHGPF